MIQAVVVGNLGRDAELKDAGRSSVCSFSVASTSKVKDSEVTTWVRCSLWGKRGESLAQYLVKGKKVAVSGELSSREHNGKTYLELNVQNLEFCGGRGDGQQRSSGQQSSATSGGGGYSDAEYPEDPSDDLPFAVSCFGPREHWHR